MSGTVEIVRRTLEELEARHEKVAPLVEEIDALERAIRDVRALLLRLDGKHDGSKSGQRNRDWIPGPIRRQAVYWRCCGPTHGGCTQR